MRRELVAMTAAVFCAGALTAAQNPGAPGQQTNPDQPRETRAASSAQSGQMTTLTGCVYKEQDVPGRTPNVAERVGILEDYILAEVSMGGSQAEGAAGAQARPDASATAGVGDAAERPGAGATDRADAGVSPGAATGQVGEPGQRETAGTTGTSGGPAQGVQHSMFKLEHEDDDRLQQLVGKRVEVTGRIDADEDDTRAAGKPAQDQSIGPDRIELPEFEISSIREIAGTCPTSPSTR